MKRLLTDGRHVPCFGNMLYIEVLRAREWNRSMAGIDPDREEFTYQCPRVLAITHDSGELLAEIALDPFEDYTLSLAQYGAATRIP